MSNNDIDFTLLAWIKRDQEERLRHQDAMVKRRAEEDELYIKQVKELVTECKLSRKEITFMMNMLSHKKEGKNFTPAQRSAITNMFYKKFYVAS